MDHVRHSRFISKLFSALLLVSILFSSFGFADIPVVRAQEEATNTILSVSDFVDYLDPKYGFQLRIPSDWAVSPARSDGIGTITTITSFDQILLEQNASVGEIILGIKIDIGLITYNRPLDVPLENWITPDSDNIDNLVSQSNIVINEIDTIKQVFQSSSGDSEYIVFIPSGQKVYFFAVIPFGDIDSAADELKIAETILQSFLPGTNSPTGQTTKSMLYQQNTRVTPPGASANAPSGYRLPFAGQKRITNGP